MEWVLDASVAMAWCFADQRTAETVELLRHARVSTILVPQHWSLEVSNVIAQAARRGKLGPPHRDEFVDLLRSLHLIVDPLTATLAMTEILDLADRHRLTAYDAAYLELAKRRRLPLATLDADLRRAAAAEGVRGI
jgi:predicted nucleic acid-binding protein